MKRSRVKWLMVLAAIAVLSISACSGKDTKPAAPAAPAAAAQPAKEFTIFARTGPDSSVWLRTVADDFTKQTGIKVNFLEQGQDGYFTNLTNQLVAGTDTFDLGVTNSTYVGPWAYGGYIDSLDSYMANFSSDFDFNDLAFSYKIDGKAYAIPYSISAHMLYYRSDLISSPPQTWDEYLALARKFTQSVTPSSPTKYGTAWTAKAGPEQPKCFYNYLWSLGGDIQVDGKAAVASDAGMKAGNYWAAFVKEKLIPPDGANYSYPEVLGALSTGVIAMAAPYWSAAYSDITKGTSPYKDKIKVAVLPGVKKADGSINRVSFNHSYTMVLNKKGKNKESAMKYYEFLCNKAEQLAYAKINGMPARYSAMGDPSLDKDFFSVALESLKITRSELLVPYYLEQHTVMNTALSGIMTNTVSVKDALNTAQSALETLYASYKK